MIERSPTVILEQFKSYVAEWRELERQYYRIPSWRVFKQLSNIKRREKLTRVFSQRMKKWGVIND